MVCLWASYEKKMWKKILNINEEKSPEPEPDPDPFVRGADPGIRIRIRNRAKMSGIPNTAFMLQGLWWMDCPVFSCCFALISSRYLA
jgi:hypothetical protein